MIELNEEQLNPNSFPDDITETYSADIDSYEFIQAEEKASKSGANSDCVSMQVTLSSSLLSTVSTNIKNGDKWTALTNKTFMRIL